MGFDVKNYPEGFERVKEELLTFVPDDKKERFMVDLILYLIQW